MEHDELLGKELWRPAADRQPLVMDRFAATYGQTDESLYRWSVDEPAAFWRAVWDFCEIKGDPGDATYVAGATMLEDRYFPNARLNVATNLLAKSGPTDAVIAYDEQGDRRSLSWDELRISVGACAAALRAEGVVAGDRVVAFIPNGLEAIVVMIAAASLGATVSTASPDFGTQGVLDRFAQIDPVVLFGCHGYSYNGKWFDTTERLAEIAAGLPTLRRTIAVDTAQWKLFLDPFRGHPVPDDLYPYDQLWYVLYSSGTTGKPKCFVHRAGGLLLKHATEHALHTNITDGDVVLYFTTTGWMMWNWLASVLARGATIVCVDGSPFFPTPSRLFDITDREGVTMLGVGAKFLDSLRKENLRPVDTHDLTSLRTIGSTGSPLVAEGFRYVYEAIKADVHLSSISGGTDLCGSFVGGWPTRPVRAGEIQGPVLGMRTDVWGDDGQSLNDRPGQRGELVCTQSFPSMPIGFWGDTDGSRFHGAYFERFPGAEIWAHGDFAAYTEAGGFVIHGRSDATLNPGGVRIGTAEITRQVELEPSIAESLVFGQDWDDDTRIVLLVRMVPGAALTDDVVADLKRRIRTNCSPRHVPAMVLAVDDLPRTRSGKLTELAVADAVNGRPVRNTEAMANPEALWAIANRPELHSQRGD
jgi:acetoacetyl-CoA synthetase